MADYLKLTDDPTLSYLREMTIFGTGNISNTTVGHNGTTIDLAVNYIYGTLLLISCPISLLLNPLVFYYSYKQKLTLASSLFLLLSAIDFLFSFRSINTTYNLLKPGLEPLYDTSPSDYQRLQAMLGYTLGYSSMFITMTMCIVRYVKIKAPFWSLNHRTCVASVAITGIVVDLLYSLSVGVTTSFVYADTWFSVLQGMISTTDSEYREEILTYAIIMVPFYIKIGFSVVFSLLTVVHLRSEEGQSLPEIKRRSIVTIVLLNAGNIVWFVTCVLSNIITESFDWEWDFDSDDHWSYEFFYVTFFDSVMAQCLLAAFNPLIFCLRNTGIRSMVKNFLSTGKMNVESVYQTTSSQGAHSFTSGGSMRNLVGGERNRY